MTRRAVLPVLCAILLLAPPAAWPSTRPAQLASRIVAAGMPGAVVLVRDRSGTRVGAAGFADLARQRRMQPEVEFRIGSVTKSLVATLVLQLAARGTLRLDDSVERWLPGRVPNGGAITLRRLLNHTSGLFDYSADPRLNEAMNTRSVLWRPLDLVAVATSHPPLFAPGASWSYSNTNYVLLGLVVQAATKSSAEAQLGRRLLRPLRLRDTSLPRTPRLRAPFARGYVLPARTDVTGVGTRWAWTAGGAVSTVRDVARFYAALLRGRILKPALLREMLRTVPVGDGGYGLGISLSRHGCVASWGHNGSVPGYTTYVLNSRSADRQLVAFVNGTPGGPEQRAAVDTAVVEAFCSS
jgi:D-alanyl-D-alanine carboxypeptidase